MTKFISVEKMSKKQKKEYYASKRMTWTDMSPITRIVPNKKKNVKKFDYALYC